MGAEQLQVFTSLLAIAAAVGGLGLLVVRIAAKYSVLAQEITAAVHHVSIWLAALVASCSTLGSLYFSAVAHYTPCKLVLVTKDSNVPPGCYIDVSGGAKR